MSGRLFFALLIPVVFSGCGDMVKSSIVGANHHSGSVKLWDIKRGSDGHDYLRFAVGTPGIDSPPEDCSLLHSCSCSHADCRKGKEANEMGQDSPNIDNVTKIWEIETLGGHDYLRFAVGSPGIETDVRSCALIHAVGCRHPDCIK